MAWRVVLVRRDTAKNQQVGVDFQEYVGFEAGRQMENRAGAKMARQVAKYFEELLEGSVFDLRRQDVSYRHHKL